MYHKWRCPTQIPFQESSGCPSVRSIWLANSCHLSASSGSASAFQPRAWSSQGAPLAYDWARLWYKGLAISSQHETLLKGTLPRAPYWAAVDVVRPEWLTDGFTGPLNAASPLSLSQVVTLHYFYLGVCFLENPAYDRTCLRVTLGNANKLWECRFISTCPSLSFACNSAFSGML